MKLEVLAKVFPEPGRWSFRSLVVVSAWAFLEGATFELIEGSLSNWPDNEDRGEEGQS